jgi:phosphoglycerate dehydrogenase-like enzyme
MPNYKILITDGLDERGQSILRAAANVDYHEKLSADDLLNVVADYDALIVRGQTRHFCRNRSRFQAESDRPFRRWRG